MGIVYNKNVMEKQHGTMYAFSAIPVTVEFGSLV